MTLARARSQAIEYTSRNPKSWIVIILDGETYYTENMNSLILPPQVVEGYHKGKVTTDWRMSK